MLKVFYNGSDLSQKLEEFNSQGVSIALAPGDLFFVGYHKPFNNIFLEFETTELSLATLTLKQDLTNGPAIVKNLTDKTNGLGRSGRITWENDKGQLKTERFGIEAFWIKFEVDLVTDERHLMGLNALFSTDQDIEEEYPDIKDYLPKGKNSFVSFHASARKDIVQVLRKRYQGQDKLLNQFDFLNIEEVRQASKYLTLSKIFDWLSDAPNDRWGEKAKAFYNKYAEYINDVLVTIDSNDNGAIDEEEKVSVQFVRLVRV